MQWRAGSGARVQGFDNQGSPQTSDLQVRDLEFSHFLWTCLTQSLLTLFALCRVHSLSADVPKLTPYQRLAKELWGRPVDGANLPTKGDAALLRLRKKCPDIRTAISSSAYARPENELISAREAVYYLASVHSEVGIVRSHAFGASESDWQERPQAMNQQDAAAAKQDTRESRQLKLRSFHLLNSFDYKKVHTICSTGMVCRGREWEA
eukprot:3609583-Rhodomonas_salina.1